MAAKFWYALKIRPSFQAVVEGRLRKLNFEVVVPEQEAPSPNYVYCRFALENRSVIASIPGVIDVLGTPVPKPINGRIIVLNQKKASRR
jgi:hypothetical protein